MLLIDAQVDEELRQVERDSIKDYISEAENLSTLHGNLKRCDEYLLKLEQARTKLQHLRAIRCCLLSCRNSDTFKRI